MVTEEVSRNKRFGSIIAPPPAFVNMSTKKEFPYWDDTHNRKMFLLVVEPLRSGYPPTPDLSGTEHNMHFFLFSSCD